MVHHEVSDAPVVPLTAESALNEVFPLVFNVSVRDLAGVEV